MKSKYLVFGYNMEYPKGGIRDCIGQYDNPKDAFDIGEYWKLKQDVPEESYWHVLQIPELRIWHEDETYSEFHELVAQTKLGEPLPFSIKGLFP